jgi:hypothetical protein
VGQRRAEAGQIGEALPGRCVAFIGQVVGGTGEGVDGADRRPQARRAQPRRDWEVLVVPNAHGGGLSMAIETQGV